MPFAVLAICLPLAAALPEQARAEQLVPVLTYHRFDPDTAKASTIVTTPVFEAQMSWLVAHHIRVVPLHDVVAAERGAAPPVEGPAVAITADDGFRTVYTQMFPIIRSEHIPVTLFLNPAMISGGGAYLTWAMIEEMRASGLIDIEAHTQTHPNFNTERARLGPEAYRDFITSQIAGSRQALQARLGVSSDYLAWPYGIHDAQLEQVAAQAGFSAAFALGSRAAAPGEDAFAIPRYQVYNGDVGARFAAVAEGHPRGVSSKAGALHTVSSGDAASVPIASSTARSAGQSP
jgi:peptidoglycan/xylan/chitin deacetylase (PgdA/CDA1 family)